MKERVQMEVLGSYGADGNIDIEELNKNLKNIDKLMYSGNEFGGENVIEQLPATVTLDGYDIIIDVKGNVFIKVTVEEAKASGEKFEVNTPIEDSFGNKVTIPTGFKIASDSATDVTGGVVIEDATYSGTIGSQFVWIPVGKVYTNIEKTDYKTITLGRYTFVENDDGTITTSEYNDTYTEDTSANHDKNYENAIAKDIEKFKKSAGINENGGYYIGRYEAGLDIDSSTLDISDMSTAYTAPNTNWTGWTRTDGTEPQLLCKQNQQVWNYITQNKASEISKDMYNETAKFTSDLVNSYAWDTAIVYIQTFGSTTYSYQKGESTDSTTPASTGMGVLSATGTVDVQCNIYDMAGNCREWTTESSNDSFRNCVHRGGHYINSNIYTSSRLQLSTANAAKYNSFRPLLYF